ncbi:MAG: transglutaminase-like domain-containing protein [Brevefilum sp.]
MNVKPFPINVKYRLGWMLLLTLVAVFVIGLVNGLTTAIWRLSAPWLVPLGLSAVAIGWCSGGVNRQAVLVFILGLVGGFFGLILFHSGVYQDIFRAFSEAQKFHLIFRPLDLNYPNLAPIAYHLYAGLNSLSVYFSELWQWLRNLTLNTAGINLVAINLVWGSLLWDALFSMGWLLRRQRHAFLASLPSLILLIGVVGSTKRDTAGLIVALSAVLAMMVIVEHLKRECRWEAQKVDYSEEIRFDILSAMIPIVALIMAFASVIPSISLEEFRSLFNLQSRIATEGSSDFVSSLGLEQAPSTPVDRSAPGGMPRSHLIGSGAELSALKIMEIDPGQVYLPPQVDPEIRLPAYYWFGRAYDVYTGSGWISGDGDSQQEMIPANQEIKADQWPTSHTVLHTISKTEDASPALYFSGELKSVDHPVTVVWHEVTGEYVTGRVSATEYQVNTGFKGYTIDQLREAEAVPPEIILETYLQVPPEVPQRMINLAGEITAQATTPYNRAKAIETYLRQFEYTLDLPPAPQDVDIVDHFLFDLQRGYCDYYASAMVILARLSGLPARFVIGYGPGTFDYNQQKFVVTEANAHAWPEIYIEPFGWVPFEPTASFSTRRWETSFESLITVSPAMPTSPSPEKSEPAEYFGLLLSALIIVFGGALWILTLLHRKKPPSTTAQIESIYQRMRSHLSQVFYEITTEPTPQELGHAYSNYLHPANHPKLTSRLSTRIISNMAHIISLYERGAYSPQKLLSYQVSQARKSLFSLRVQSWLFSAGRMFRKS